MNVDLSKIGEFINNSIYLASKLDDWVVNQYPRTDVFGDMQYQNGFLIGMLRSLGWLIVQGIANLLKGAENLLSAVYSTMGFLYDSDSPVGAFIQKFSPYFFIPVLFALIFIGYQMIIKSPEDRPKALKNGVIMQNIIILICVFAIVPMAAGGANTVQTICNLVIDTNNTTMTTQIERDRNVDDSKRAKSTSEIIAENYVNDYLYMWANATNAEKNNEDNADSMPIPKLSKKTVVPNISYDTYGRNAFIGERENKVNNKYYLDMQAKDIFAINPSELMYTTGYSADEWEEGRYLIDLHCDGQGSNIQIIGSSDMWNFLDSRPLNEMLGSYNYRYNIDWLPLFISLIATGLVILFSSLKTAKIIYELAVGEILALFFALGDIMGGDKIKALLKALLNLILTLLINLTLLEFFLMAQKYLSVLKANGTINAVEEALILFFFALAAVDGPYCLQQIMSINAGTKSAAATIAGTAFAATRAAKSAGQGISKLAHAPGKAVAGIHGFAINGLGGTRTGKSIQQNKDQKVRGMQSREALNPDSERNKQNAFNAKYGDAKRNIETDKINESVNPNSEANKQKAFNQQYGDDKRKLEASKINEELDPNSEINKQKDFNQKHGDVKRSLEEGRIKDGMNPNSETNKQKRFNEQYGDDKRILEADKINDGMSNRNNNKPKYNSNAPQLKDKPLEMKTNEYVNKRGEEIAKENGSTPVAAYTEAAQEYQKAEHEKQDFDSQSFSGISSDNLSSKDSTNDSPHYNESIPSGHVNTPTGAISGAEASAVKEVTGTYYNEVETAAKNYRTEQAIEGNHVSKSESIRQSINRGDLSHLGISAKHQDIVVKTMSNMKSKPVTTNTASKSLNRANTPINLNKKKK